MGAEKAGGFPGPDPYATGGGQDRAAARGWGVVFYPNRPKTSARDPTIPQKTQTLLTATKGCEG